MPSFERPQKPDNSESTRGHSLIRVGLHNLKERVQIGLSEFPTHEESEDTAEAIRRSVESIFTGIEDDALLPIEQIGPDDVELYEAILSYSPESYAAQDIQGPRLYTVDMPTWNGRKTVLFLPLEGSILRVDHDELREDYRQLRLEKIFLNQGGQGDSFDGAWSISFLNQSEVLLMYMAPDEPVVEDDREIIQKALHESIVEIYSSINAILPEDN